MMQVSSVGYLMGNMNVCTGVELGKARTSSVVNKGSYAENKRLENGFSNIVNNLIMLFMKPDVKLEKQALDMIA